MLNKIKRFLKALLRIIVLCAVCLGFFYAGMQLERHVLIEKTRQVVNMYQQFLSDEQFKCRADKFPNTGNVANM